MIYGIILLLLATGGSGAARSSSVQFERVAKQADAARQENRLDEAVGLYERALKLNSRWKEGWWFLGTLFYDRDRYAEAREAFQKFVALDPKAGAGWALFGLCEFQTKDYQHSLRHLLHARQVGIESPEMRKVVMYHTALLFTHFEQYENASQTIQGLVLRGEETPAVVEAAGIASLRKPLLPPELPAEERDMVMLAGRAICAVTTRNVAEAQQQFQQLVGRYGDQPNVHYMYGSFLLAGDPAAGVREFEKELQLNPHHVPALVAAAMEYLKEGDASKGLPYAERAVSAEPQNFAVHAALGRILMGTGALDRAIQELESSERLAPDSLQVRIALASAYAKAGRKDDAARERAAFRRLQQLSESSGDK